MAKRSVSKRLRAERGRGSPVPWIVAVAVAVGLGGVWLATRRPGAGVPVKAPGVARAEGAKKGPVKEPRPEPATQAPRPAEAEPPEAAPTKPRKRWKVSTIDRLLSLTPDGIEQMAEDLARRRVRAFNAGISAEFNVPGGTSAEDDRGLLEDTLPYARATVKVCMRAARVGRANGISDLAIEKFIESCWMPTEDTSKPTEDEILKWLRFADGK